MICPGLGIHQSKTMLPRKISPWPFANVGMEMFAGAGGIIGFSPVGFDSNLNGAIVSASFSCGVFCGRGHRYVLHEVRGHSHLVDGLMTRVS